MSLAATPAPGLTERDFAAVRDLIAEIRQRETREGLVQAVVTWQNAFTVFKKLERHLGLPVTAPELAVYQAIVSDLRSIGYPLAAAAEAATAQLQPLGIRPAALRGCLSELEIGDEVGALGENAPALARLSAHFG